MNHGVVFIIHL